MFIILSNSVHPKFMTFRPQSCQPVYTKDTTHELSVDGWTPAWKTGVSTLHYHAPHSKPFTLSLPTHLLVGRCQLVLVSLCQSLVNLHHRQTWPWRTAGPGPKTDTVTHWQTQSLTDRHSHSLTDTVTHWQTQSLTDRHSHSLTDTVTHWQTQSLTDRHSHSLTDTVTHWQTQSLADRHSHSLTDTVR